MSETSHSAHVMVLDDDESIRWVLQRALRQHDWQVTACASVAEARTVMSSQNIDLLLSDIRMPGADGISFAREIKTQRPQMPVILMTAHADMATAVQSFDAGAFEFVAKPFDLDELSTLLQRALTRTVNSTSEPQKEKAAATIIGRAPAMQPVFRAIGKLARTPFSVLIMGESGTGKELIARALHEHSARAQAPFVALNMAAIPHELIEAELFGYEKGAFTGAGQRSVGKFEQAQNGSLFLDEIGDMPLSAQTRLLRVLSDGGFYRVGGTNLLRCDVRIIAATHQDLAARVQDGRFRADLYHRLNVVRVDLPALRERGEDIAVLLEHFLQSAAQEAGLPRKNLHADALAQLLSYDWPGNVRQLENLCRFLTVMALSDEVQYDDLPAEFKAERPAQISDWQALLRAHVRALAAAADGDGLQQLQKDLEAMLVLNTLELSQGHKQETARLLGWGRNTLTRYLQAQGLDSDADPH